MSRRRVGSYVTGCIVAGAVSLTGWAQSSDPKPIPDLIPVAAIEPEQLPSPRLVETNAATTSSITLEWSGPDAIRTNKPNPFVLTVRNTSDQPIQRVVVQVRVPDGVTATNVAPEAKTDLQVLLWDLGTLAAKETRDLRFSLATSEKRDLTCRAWVTLTGTSGWTIAVREPKLDVKLTAPKEIVLGDPIAVKYTVTNVGDAAAEVPAVKLRASGTDARDVPMQSLGTRIEPGETKTGEGIWLPTAGGEIRLMVNAEAEGDVHAVAQTSVKVLVPKLTVAIAGPTERQIGCSARFTVTAMNEGTVPLRDVTVRETFPPGFRFVSSSIANAAESGAVTWSLGSLPPGGTKSFTYDAVAVCPGPAMHLVRAVGNRNVVAEAKAKTVVEGIPAMRMEVVDLADPVEKGGETTYEIKLTNTGTRADSQVRLECSLPPELKFVKASGPTDHVEKLGIDFNGKTPTKIRTIAFEPIAELAPKTETVFRVTVKAVGTGDVRFKASLTSLHLATPVTKEESTRVYGE